MTLSNIKIDHLDSYKADTAIIPLVIDTLINDLRKASYPQDEVDEIVLAMDEAITNAVQETLSKQEEFQIKHNLDNREITVRYSINDNSFDSTIIDHGKGLDIKKMMLKIPQSDELDYHDQVVAYATNSEKKRLKVRLNGKEIILNGIGAGLKIILAFMDSVTIDLIDKQKILSDSVSEYTDGTILNLKRKKRY